MSDRFISWYRSRAAPEQWRDEVSSFLSCGISINHPKRQRATILNVDGDQVEVDEDLLAEVLAWRMQGGVDFQWWLTADVDVACRIANYPDDCETQTFYLDGLTTDQVSLVESALMMYLSQGGIETLGLVVDRTGATVGSCNWDEIILGGSTEISCCPDVLVLPERRLLELHFQVGHRATRRLPGGLVYVGE